MCGYRGGDAVGAVLIGWTRRRRSGCMTTSSTSHARCWTGLLQLLFRCAARLVVMIYDHLLV
uniref:Uncharacterized protein n=1 Tax=Arundo donax TaxID=35708 RepID=A0A0A9DN38_ARUDO